MYSNIALSIGGSDSGGGAGIQADLRTFMALKVHGCSVITCVTAQNSVQVKCVEPLKKDTLISQIDTLFSDFDIKSLKTGMLLNDSIINATALKLKSFSIPKIIDPVMVSRTGSKLLEDSAINAYKKLLLPIADLVTPNIFEANLLSNLDIKFSSRLSGNAYIMFGAFAYAIYVVAMRRYVLVVREDPLSSLATISWTSLIGCLMFVPFVINESPWNRVRENEEWALIAYLGVLSTALCYVFFAMGVETIGANKAASFINVVPIFGILSSWL